MVLNTLLSYRDSIWYCNTGNTRVSLAQRSKLTQLTSKLIDNSLRLQSLILFYTRCFRTTGEKNVWTPSNYSNQPILFCRATVDVL